MCVCVCNLYYLIYCFIYKITCVYIHIYGYLFVYLFPIAPDEYSHLSDLEVTGTPHQRCQAKPAGRSPSDLRMGLSFGEHEGLNPGPVR